MADKAHQALTFQATPQDIAQRITTAQLAARLNIKATALIRMGHNGTLPTPTKLGKLYLWDVAETEAALQASKGGK